MMIGAGLDAAIIDPEEKALKAMRFAATALAGQDNYCMKYMQFIKDSSK